MGKEVWQKGHGPEIVEVLGREIVDVPNGPPKEIVYLKGRLPQFGEPHKGLQGEETKVERVMKERQFVTEWQNP